MDFPVKSAASVRQKTACAILPVFESGAFVSPTKDFDKASRGQLRTLMRRGEVSGKLGSTRLLPGLKGCSAERVLVVGCGKPQVYSRKALYTAVVAATQTLKSAAIREAVSFLTYEPSADIDAHYGVRLTVEAVRSAMYAFNECKSKPASAPKLSRFGLAIADEEVSTIVNAAITEGSAIANGSDIARDLGNRPPNICTPSHLAEVAKEIGKKHSKLAIKVLTEKEMTKLGMGALLSVAQGAVEPPRLIVMDYRGGAKDEAPIAICGKGITFDTGGISIKPPPKMDEMKWDMAGAASVIGTMAAIAELGVAANVLGIIAASENMPSGSATRPGDIVTSMSGKTIEILNTDAEGRLVLCDAITYAQTFDPSCVLDVATLTGACVIALGGVYTGVFSNDDVLCDELVAAGQRSLDLAWPMPADAEYGESLASNFADFANVGAREGGASIAASFLSRFIDEGRPWAHLDIAGVAWKTGSAKGSTGRPVPMLVDFLLDAEQPE